MKKTNQSELAKKVSAKLRKALEQREREANRVVSMEQLRMERATPLKLEIEIPVKVLPLFYALSYAHSARRLTVPCLEDFASNAICRWMVSEEAMKPFDDLVNEITAGLD